MRKLKKILSLTVGFVGCMLAGVFALQAPKAQPVEALTSSSAGKISYVLPNNTTATDLRTIFWIEGLGAGMLDIPVGETSQTNSALANFAKQVKIIKADASTTTMDQCGTIEVLNDQEIRWNGISSGDTIIIRQGTTFQYDANNDGTYEDDFVAMYSFQLTYGGSCASLGCASKDVKGDARCTDGVVHSVHLGTCTETSITSIGIINFAGGEQNIYLQMNGLSLVGPDASVKANDRTDEDIANWSKQLLFATPNGYDANGKPTGYTMRNYYEHALEVEPNYYGIQVQNSANINFTSFRNEYEMLIIPKGATLAWDINGDEVLEYYWVASQRYVFMRWKGANTALDAFNCSSFVTETGCNCITNIDGDTTFTGKCNGFIHQMRFTGTDTTVVTLVSETATDNSASLTINNNRLEFPGQYTFDASTWTYNGASFTDVCDVNIANGYINFTKKKGDFAHKDLIIIPAGAVITNTITGNTYRFSATRQLYFLEGKWYAFDTYYEVTQVTQISNNTANNLYVWFADENGNAVNNGYNMSNDTGGWYSPDQNTIDFKNYLTSSVAIDNIQVGGQSSGLYFNNVAGQFATNMNFTIPQGAVWYANAKHNAGVTAQVIWYFPYAISVTTTSVNTFTQIVADTLPKAPETTGNNVFVGYKLVNRTTGEAQPKLYQPGFAYDPVTYKFEAVTVEMYMEKGASLRLSETADQSGIRWTVYVNKAQLESVKALGTTINLGVRVRLVNANGQISKTESAKTCVTDVLGTSVGNYYEEGNYIVYHMAYVMNDSFVALETQNNYKWLGDGFVEIVNSDASTVKAYAVQNDNARSYKAMVDYFLNHSCTTEATEINTFQITRTLADGSTEIRYYSFWNVAYNVLVSEAARIGVEIKATDNTTYQNGLV